MVQAPYGTGVFICRKGLMAYTCTDEASYVSGADFTLSGSRSGANAIAVWMILMTYGKEGWTNKIRTLAERADRFSQVLTKLGIEHYRADASNILTLKAEHISGESAQRFGLVPDDHHNPKWYKIVVMDHVTDERLKRLETELSAVLKR
jgi:glutamate/tyrosine decarboxylase-like PLP-dependent enzyme